MREHDLTPQVIADKIGLENRQDIGRLQSGKTRMSPDWAKRISPIFSMGWLDFWAAHQPEKAVGSIEERVILGDTTPKVGDPIKDENEVKIIGLWRRLDKVNKVKTFFDLGFNFLPSLDNVDS